MLPQNKRFSEICNITQYHNYNIKGQGIKIAVFDFPFKPGSPIFNNKVRHIDRFNSEDYPLVSHGSSVCHVIHQILPEAEIYFLPNSTESIYWCIENGIDIISISMSWGASRDGYLEASEKAVEKGMLLFTSAGNSSEDWMLRNPARKKPWIAVGAVHLMNSGMPSEYITRANYSSYTRDNREIWEMVEIMGFAKTYIISPYNMTEPYTFGGTSSASPWVAGMCGLLKQIKNLTKSRFRELDFMQQNCIDLEEIGYDKETGYGLFRLPDLDKLKDKLIDFSISVDVKRLHYNSLKLTANSNRLNTNFRFDIREMSKEIKYKTIKPYFTPLIDNSFIWNNAKENKTYEIVCHAETIFNEYLGKYIVFGNTDKSQIIPFKGLTMKVEKMNNANNQIKIEAIPEGGSNVIYAIQYRRFNEGNYNSLDSNNPYQLDNIFYINLDYGKYEIVIHGIDVAGGEMVYHGSYCVFENS